MSVLLVLCYCVSSWTFSFDETSILFYDKLDIDDVNLAWTTTQYGCHLTTTYTFGTYTARCGRTGWRCQFQYHFKPLLRSSKSLEYAQGGYQLQGSHLHISFEETYLTLYCSRVTGSCVKREWCEIEGRALLNNGDFHWNTVNSRK